MILVEPLMHETKAFRNNVNKHGKGYEGPEQYFIFYLSVNLPKGLIFGHLLTYTYFQLILELQQ